MIDPFDIECADSSIQLTVILETVSEAILVRTGEEIVYLNSAANTLFGGSAKNPIQKDTILSRHIHPDDQAIIEGYYMQRLGEEEAPSEYEIRLLQLDGRLLWVSCRASKIIWQGQLSILVCLRDISDQKNLLEASGFSSNLFRDIFNSLPDAMLLTDLRDGKILDVNPAFLNVFGQRRTDVVGCNAGELDVWTDTTFLRRFVEELKMTTTMMDIPTTVKTRGGVIRHFQLFAQKVDYGSDPLLLMIGRDVTDDLLKKQEMKRGRDNAELANKSKSAFLADMSHELRTPLNGILGFAEIIKDEMIGVITNQRYCEYAADIHTSGTHLLEIINDILDLSKVEAGHLGAHLEWVDPIGCLDTCMGLIQRQAYEAQIILTRNLDETVLLEADERLIKQIVINLLSNAVKYSETGSEVTLSMQRTGNAGVCLSVADTGIGMTAEEIKIAKRPFGQVSSRLSNKQAGSGLGLPLVKAFADKLSATMVVESQPEVGTSVSLFFPPDKVKNKTADAHEDQRDI